MELIIKDIKSAEDVRLFTGLAKRLGLKTTKLTAAGREDIGLAKAIETGRKSGYVSGDVVMEALHNIQGEK